jgi:hypothetical protein
VPGKARRVLSLRFRRVSFLFSVARGKSARSRVAKRPTPCLRRARPAIRQLGPHMIRARDGRARGAGGCARDRQARGDAGRARPAVVARHNPFRRKRRRHPARRAVAVSYGFAFNSWKAGWQLANCRGSQRATRNRGAGQAAWGTFSGSRSRGTVFGSQALRHQHRLCMRWLRPRMMPAPVPQATCPGTRVACKGMVRTPDASGRWWCLRAQARFAAAPMLAGQSAVDAAERCRQSRPPTSVGWRTGAPPPPCRHEVGRLTVRGQTNLSRRAPLAPQGSPPESRPEVEHPASCLSRQAVDGHLP